MLPSVGPHVIIANIALTQEDRERLLGLSFITYVDVSGGALDIHARSW